MKGKDEMGYLTDGICSDGLDPNGIETCICGNDRCCGECCDPREEMYMGSDSDFSDHALGIDY